MVENKIIIQSIYFLLFVFMLAGTFSVCFINQAKIKKNVSAFFSILMALIAGLRWKTGTDWEPYHSLFQNITFENLFTIKHHEIGYKLFNLFVKTIWNNYTFFLLVLSFVAVFLVYWSIVESKTNSIIAIQFFYTNYFLAHYLGSNRRIIAIGLGLCAIILVNKSKKKQAFLFILLAMLFHRTAVVLFVIFFIPQKKIPDIYLILITILVTAIGLSNAVPRIIYYLCYFGEKITNSYGFTNAIWHLNNMAIERGSLIHNIFGILKRVAYLIIFMLTYKNSKAMHKNYYFFNIYFVSFLLYCLLINIGTYAIMSTYLCIVEIILWGNIVRFSKNKNEILWIILIILLEIIQFFNCFKGQYGFCFFPYNMVS